MSEAEPAPVPPTGRAASRPRGRRWRQVLLAVVTFVLALELCLQLFDVQMPMHRTWLWHPVLGWTQVRDKTFDLVVDGRPVHTECNALGFRDTEHALAKPPGTRRLVAVGDSFCEAMQVNLADTFQRRLAALLAERDGVAVEPINLGVGDWGQAQELIALREYGFAYAPDLVVCEVFPLNDLANNSLELYGVGKSHNDHYRPYFVEQDGLLVETRHQPWLQPLRHSRVFLAAERAVRSLAWSLESGGEEQKWAARARAIGFPGLPPLLHAYVPEAAEPPVIARAWHLTERLLAEMAALCRSRGVPFVVVVVAWQATIGDAWTALSSGQPPPAMDRDYPERRLGAFCAGLGVPMLPTQALFTAHPDSFTSDGHLNVAGHRLLAEALLHLLDERHLGLPAGGAADSHR